MKETIKGSEKINMILFGRKKFVSEFLKAMPQLWMSHVQFPSLLPQPSSAASRERGKVFGLKAVGHSMADKFTQVEVTVRPSPGGPDKRARGALDGAFTVQAVVGLVV